MGVLKRGAVVMNAELNRIHQEALGKFHYTTEVAEHWMTPEELKAYPQLHGDCDDFAGYCVMRLREKNIPARFVFCKAPGGYHLVCESDGWILDNCQPMVCRQDDLDYQWISISGFKPGDAWHTIKE